MPATKLNSIFNMSPWERDESHIKSYLAFDTETTGLDAYRGARIFAWSTCDEKGNVTISRYDTDLQSRKKIQDLLYDTSVAKICHNAHFDWAMLQMDGFIIPSDTVFHCTMLIAQILNNLEPSNELDQLAYVYGKYPIDQDLPIKTASRIYGSYDKIPKYLMNKYQHADAERTMLLFLSFFPIIKKQPDLYITYLVELALVKTTIRFERRGIMICRPEINKLINNLQIEINEIHTILESIFPYQLNLNSPQQLQQLLYKELNLPVQHNKKGTPSVDKDAIETLSYYATVDLKDDKIITILDTVLKYRAFTKGIQTLQTYLDAVDTDDILYPHINTNRARTGRESSENPNMQNVQKNVSLKTRYSVPCRKGFRARPGYFLLLRDYSGIEMRIAVLLTGSDRLIQLLHDGFDFHDACAKTFFGLRYTDSKVAVNWYISSSDSAKRKKEYRKLIEKLGIDKAREELFTKVKGVLRSAAKNARFAMLYGAGKAQTARTLMLSMDEVEEGYEKDRKEFPEFYSLMNRCEKEAKRYGFIKTIFGRKLFVNTSAWYASTDFKIQGTAGELFKRSQIRVDHYLQTRWSEYDIAIWMVVHDEMILEVPRAMLPYLQELISDLNYLMTEYDEITVPLDVGNKITTYLWADAKKLKEAA